MATTLQQQLAAINAKSTDQLNLKAQKERHSRSLLFDPREAAGQSFDTIFQICSDGFTELCQLDRRFQSFARNLFAGGSVSVEREHMTAKENSELDKVIEQFLGLVTGRLLLRPAQKSLEWLIRRWKIHEYNAAILVFAFLPYHDHEFFPTILSLLPKQLPHALTFLKPYIASLQSPPRHVLASAAVSNQRFLADYTSFVLGAATRKQQSSIMLGLWASIIARAVNAMLDAAQSGREEVRRQKMEDVMTKILPILQDTLSITSSQELFVASCIIITLLASRGQLTDPAIDALMESITTAWSPNTMQEAIECLVLLAEEKEKAKLPKQVARAIAHTDGAVGALLALQDRFETNKIVTGVLLQALSDMRTKGDSSSAQTIQHIMADGVISSTTAVIVRERVAELTQGDSRSYLEELKRSLAIEHSSASNPQDADVAMIGADEPDIDHMQEDEPEPLHADLQSISADLPKLPADMHSFLASDFSGANYAEKYATWFEVRCNHGGNGLDQDLMSVLGISPGSTELIPRYLSFLAVFWCSIDRSVSARTKALALASTSLEQTHEGVVVDYQALYPSLLLGLSDPVQSVRRAAAIACETLPKITEQVSCVGWYPETVYGSSSQNVLWLEHDLYASFFDNTIATVLEDCVLGPSVAQDVTVQWLNQSAKADADTSSVCEALASHGLADGRTRVADLIFSIVGRVGKSATMARQTIVCPYLGNVLREAQTPGYKKSDVVVAAIHCLSHRTPEEIDTLKQMAEGDSALFASAAFKRLSAVFERAKSVDKKALLDWLLDQAVVSSGDNAAVDTKSAAASDTLRSMKIPIDVLTHQLHILLRKSSSQDVARPFKKTRIHKVAREQVPEEADHDHLYVHIKAATICLELIEDSLHDEKPGQDSQELLHLFKGLFSLLAELQSWRSNTGSDFSYLQSLTLANMAAILTKVRPTAEQLNAAVMRTDLIVDTLRSASSPQVHNNALLLISKIATLAPDTVLHSVMPLFTFMSSSTLRQADAYSAHVITMTIESIVPPMVASIKKRGKNLVAGVSDLLLSFIAAFEHIPSTRRLSTFVQLLKTLGPYESLYAVLAMLTERYEGHTMLDATLHGIMSSFTVNTQVNALSSYLRLVEDACNKRRTLSDTILAFQEKNPAEAHTSVRVLLDGFATIVRDNGLRKSVAAQMRDTAAVDELRTLYENALELLVGLPSREGVINFDEPGLKRAHREALEALLRLLPLTEFIDSSAALMQVGTEAVRSSVFASLTARVADAKNGDVDLARVFLEALPNCAAFLAASQPISVRQAALLCIDAICEKFGRLDRDAVSDVLSTITGPAALTSDSAVLQTAAMLCLASAVEVLGDSFVSLSANSVQISLDHAQTGLRTNPVDWRKVNAAFTFFNAILDYEAWLLASGDNLDRAIMLACAAAQAESTSEPVEEFCKLAPKKIKLSTINAALLKTFDEVFDIGLLAIARLVQIEHAVIQYHTKKEVLKNSQSLLAFVLRAFEIRERLEPQLAGVTSNDDMLQLQLTGACDETTRATLDLTLKLNDNTFRPFFIQLVDWAQQSTNRSIALYDYTTVLFGQLGSIVTSYASYILDNARWVLEGAETKTESREESLLLERVLTTLAASFRHDQDDFWTGTSHFAVVAEPLLNLLSFHNAPTSVQASEVIVDLAAAVASSPELLKTMNTQIMTLMRNDDSKVRLAAVRCQRAITDKLTFDWLNLLPEMLPFISELLEDDDEDVEREALRWVSQLEEVTGESLEGMLA